MSFLPCQPNQSRQKKPISGKPQAVKPAQKDVVQKKLAPDKTKGLRLLKETPQASLVQKKPAPDKVENLAMEYLSKLKEVDVTFEKGTAVLERYRAKYPELASYIREIVPGKRRIEIRQRLEGEDISLRLFAIRVLEG
jgi:type III secretory pathway component EscV